MGSPILQGMGRYEVSNPQPNCQTVSPMLPSGEYERRVAWTCDSDSVFFLPNYVGPCYYCYYYFVKLAYNFREWCKCYAMCYVDHRWLCVRNVAAKHSRMNNDMRWGMTYTHTSTIESLGVKADVTHDSAESMSLRGAVWRQPSGLYRSYIII